MTSLELATKIAKIMDGKKATDIRVLKINEISSLGDYFVLASAGNTTLTQAMADDIDFTLGKEYGIQPRHIEGYASATWILMDYADVIVHIFYAETREFYSLERLWSDAKVEEIKFEEAEK